MTNIEPTGEQCKPDVPPLNLERFPTALDPLKKIKRWLTWRWEVNSKGKLTKKPYWGHRPKYPAAVNKPKAWGSFKAASFALEKRELGTDGIGFVLLDTNICAFDIDDCRDPRTGQIHIDALNLVKRANSYTEITVSGTGLRIIGYGSDRYVHGWQMMNSVVKLESYRNCPRFITISGNQLEGTADTLADIDELMDTVVNELGGFERNLGRHVVEDVPENDEGLNYTEFFIESRYRPHEDTGTKLLELIKTGESESGDRSVEFFKAVRDMKDWGIPLSTAINLLRRHPDGIAEKYNGRLETEASRAYGKADRDPPQGGTPDAEDDDGEPEVKAKGNESTEAKTEKTRGKIKPDPDDEAPRGMIASSAEFTRDFVPPDYLLDGVCLKGFMYALTAPTGSGKTSLLMLLAMCVALGREFAGLEVSQGKVLYLAGENPDDVRMRWIAMAEHMGFDAEDIDVHFIAGTFELNDPRLMGRLIKSVNKKMGGACLVIIDTGPSFFMGENENDNVDMINHAKMLRSLVELPGNPTVIAAMHPTKAANKESLLPRGGGAFLAEIDGNLVAWKDDMTVTMHWAGKHRGVNFDPMVFELESVTARKLLDSRGRSIPTVIASALSAEEVNAMAKTKRDDEDTVLLILSEEGRNQAPSLNDIADEAGFKTGPIGKQKINKTKAQRLINALRDDKLVEKERSGGWVLTKKGKEAADKVRTKGAQK